MERTRVVGFVLWRAGIFLIVGYSAFMSLRRLLAFADPQLEIAVSVALTGLVFLFLSVLTERIEDAKEEGSLSE